ncbi:MAG: ABC transporter substrate-binding protein [Anaerolineae bacterium]
MKNICAIRSSTSNNSRRPRGIPLLLTMVLLLAGLLAAGCRSATATQAVKIGLIAPFEGAQRELGYAVLAAVQMAIRERNAVGGIAGRPIELVALNDEMDPGMSALQMEKLALDPAVVGVIGPWSPAAVRAVLPVAGGRNLPVVLATLFAGDLPPNTVMLAPAPSDLAQAATEQFQFDSKVRVVLAVADEGLEQTMRETFAELGWPAAGEREADSALAGEAIAVVGMESLSEIAQLEDARYSRALVLYGPYAPLLRRLVPPERWPTVYVWDCARQERQSQRFVEQYQVQTGQKPLAPALLAYGAAQVLFEAVSTSPLVRQSRVDGAGRCAGGSVKWVPLSELP